MDMNEKPKLSGVPETMLQTVYARAKETKTRGAIKDTKAVEIIDKINYDFSLADKDSAMHSGVVARTIVLDKLANKYLAKNKGAVVVNIACGLDTRCYRMNGYTHWYNLDLPETIAVREKLLPESGEISQIAMSAMDDWSGEITEHDAPAIVIIEGLTMYLSEKDVKEIFDVISKRFEHVTVLVETMSPTMVKRMKEKSIEGSKAKFTWGVKDGKELAKLLPNFRLIEDIREGELLALTAADFDFEKETVRINKSYQRLHGEDVITTPKTKKSNRIIKMPKFLCEEMREYLQMLYGLKKKDRIFTVTKSYLHHEMDRGAKAAGVKRIRIHDLRHSHISLLIDMGFSAVAIADRVGHESIDITYQYAHLFPSKQTEMADRLDDLGKGEIENVS